MAAVDAQFYWMSAKIPNDEFLLYAFGGEPDDLDGAMAQVVRRARACADLGLVVDDGSPLTYPRWVHAPVEAGRVARRDVAGDGWAGCLDAVAELTGSQLDIREKAWQVHIFAPVRGIPGVRDAGVVAVLQIAHALADGARASAMAAWLFGRQQPVPVVRTRAGFLPWRGVVAARAHRRFVRDTDDGVLAPTLGSRPLLATNSRPTGARLMRTLVRRRGELAGPTVTVAVLSAISTALSDLLGPAAASSAAEVPMAKPGKPLGFNHFGNVVVGLYPELGPDDRVSRIVTDLSNGRRRFEHPATRASDEAFAAVPAMLLRWGVSQFDADVRAEQVSGNTVVSSVHRGVADLHFGGVPVVLTAGYPGLSPMMGLTHGVHGIGDTVAISVHAAPSAVPDVDGYLRLLDAAL
ncbi:WS/DGAT domain-containing protein [Mycobacterium camsae]|uniref:WS/DGAT domain-containing protein n=1 Tax=Mycobacterium gordonae TaxID=1778 RepID=UPI001981AB71|nr:WS/DGAT domain-containing protein [Mycobacterium gordonae]